MNDEHTSVRFFRVSDLSLLRVEGPDAISFLQGQVTCDVKGLTVGAVTLGALCTPQGRTIAVFRLIRDDSSCTLILRTDLLETVRTRLQRYVLRAKVTLQAPREEWLVYALLGHLDEFVASALQMTEVPSIQNSARVRDDCTLLAVDRPDKYLLLVPSARSEALQSGLASRDPQTFEPGSEWELAEIRDGIPVVTPATSEEFVPQMLNLDQLGAVAFDKGCYTGQEVIARTHYLGAVKRRMHRFKATAQQPPEPSDRMVMDRDASTSGQVVRAARVKDRDYELLAVIHESQTSEPSYRLYGPEGPRLEILTGA